MICASYNLLNSPAFVTDPQKQFRSTITKIHSILLPSAVQSNLWQVSFVNPRAGTLLIPGGSMIKAQKSCGTEFLLGLAKSC